MTKKVLIAGFTGAMGQKAVNLVNKMDDFEIVAGLSPIAKMIQKNILYRKMLKFLNR